MGEVTKSQSAIIKAFADCRTGLLQFASRFARRGADVEDYVQEAFLRSYDAAERSRIDNPKGYLFTAAKNIAVRDSTNLASKLTDYIEDYGGPALSSSESSVFDVIADREEIYCLGRAIEELPPQCRKVIKLRLIHQMSQKDIADELGISVSTVEKHVAKGLRRCEAYLQMQGFDRAAPEKKRSSS